MCCTISLVLGEAPSKTQVFRCFHSHQATRITNVLKPFLFSLGTWPSALLHQSWKIMSSGPGARYCSPTLHHTCHQMFQSPKLDPNTEIQPLNSTKSEIHNFCEPYFGPAFIQVSNSSRARWLNQTYTPHVALWLCYNEHLQNGSRSKVTKD
jgi:hypothetical protein